MSTFANVSQPSGVPSHSSTVPSDTLSSSGLGGLGGDAFMRLLVEQMRAQDPTDPQSATDYVAQLATFAEVEQSVQIREALDALGRAGALSDAAAAIGRRVTGPGGEGGVIASVRIASDTLVATLEDGSTLELGPGVTLGSAR